MLKKLNKYISLLQNGDLVAIPTETVYGLAADATNDAAVDKIFALKKRPNFNPLISHISDIKMAQKYGVFSDTALQLARHFWPGPLTLIIPKGAHACADNVTAGLDTIGLRVPSHPLTRQLIKDFGKPLAAPSANISGTLSPTHPDHVRSSFGVHAPEILDGGACSVGLESTILRVIDDNVILLRQGGIPQSDIENFLRSKIDVQINADKNGKVLSPGQLLRHYAPKKPIYIDQTNCPDTASFIAFGKTYLPQNTSSLFQLSSTEDLSEAASLLFSHLYHADQSSSCLLYTSPSPRDA